MKIVWDERKRSANITKHGMDFSALTVDFFEAATFYPAKRGRILAIGELNGEIIVAVVFKVLGTEGVSVVSLRPASKKERSL